MKTYFNLTVLLACTGLYFSCTTPTSKSKQLDSKAPPDDTAMELIVLSIGQEHHIDLPDHSTAGYSWFFEVSQDWIISVKELDTPPLQPDSGQNPSGAASQLRFSVKGLKEGEAILRFYQVRPWEKQQKPTNENYYKIQVLSGQ